MNGDNADFAALSEVGGAAHPSGYPLYVMWLRAWSWLPGSPAHAAALSTILFGSLAVLVMHAACRAWGARPFAATIAAALFATGPVVLRIHTEADCFALNSLIAATVLWLAANQGPLRGWHRALALGLVAGLGLSNNLTCALVAPIGILGVVRGVRESPARRPVAVLLAIGGLVAGLTPYVYLLVVPDTAVSWGKVDDLAELVRYFLRQDYGSWRLSAHGDDVSYGVAMGALIKTIGRGYLYLPAAIGCVGCALAIARPLCETRTAWLLLLASFVLSGPIVGIGWNVEPTHLGLYLVQRFHILPLLVFGVFVASGLDRLGDAIAARWAELPRRALLAGVLTVVGVAAVAALSLPFVGRVHSRAIEQGLRNLLVSLPPDAIVIGATDEFHFGLGYLQGAIGLRPDVSVITTPQLGLAFYRDRVRARTGIVIDPSGTDDKISVTVAEHALRTGRPLFIDPYQANIAKRFATHPYGLVFRVLPDGTPPPPIAEVFAINRALYERYQFDYPLPGPEDQLATQFHMHYARAWSMIAEGLGRAGLREEAGIALQYAEALEPQ